MPAMGGRAWAIACVLALGAGLGGCKKGSPPTIVDPGNRTAVVGETLTIDVFASDKDGDRLSYDYRAAGVPEVDRTAVLSVAPDGHGVFMLTPLASQVGQHIFDFIVSDGTFSTTLSITIDIVGASGDGSMPVFRKPLSEGTVLDLETAECVGFEIEIEDADTTSIELTQEAPVIAGAQLDAASDGLSGTWEWCPDREQKEGDDQWALGLSADDGDNPPVIKDFLVVVRKRSGEDCPMQPPSIAHDAHDFETLLDLEIVADVSDDVGLRNAPVVLYAYEDPGTPVDFVTLSNVSTMELVEGDMRRGTWSAFIPNPTATQGQGAQATVWYLISATDNDDVEGDCDHRVDHPVDGTHAVDVENTGEGGAGLCEPCSFDVQCGDDDDHCLPGFDGSFCGQGCADDCPSGYTCTVDAVLSIDGDSGRQCVPDVGSCDGGSGGACEDDEFEDDDTADQGIAAGTAPEGAYEGVACPGDDDWWLVEIEDEAQIVASLAAPSPPDLDLAITDDAGVLIEQSIGFTSDEALATSCLAAGQYLLRVWSVAAGGEHASYEIAWSSDASACGTPVGTGDCCEAQATPGCEDGDVQDCTCEIDGFCCENNWDEMCVSKAQASCGLSCGGGDEGCCDAHSTPGCDDAAVEACVCATDPFCCGEDDDGVGFWDATCVDKVGDLLCASACVPDDSDGACCEPHSGGGCEIDAVETCVCAEDPMCCQASPGWDAFCVEEIGTFDCGTCP
jgi:hypothetical protein